MLNYRLSSHSGKISSLQGRWNFQDLWIIAALINRNFKVDEGGISLKCPISHATKAASHS